MNRKQHMTPTPAEQLLNANDWPTAEHSLGIDKARARAQATANAYGEAIAVGWQLNDDTGEKELGWCPARIAPHNSFVVQVLDTVSPKEVGK